MKGHVAIRWQQWQKNCRWWWRGRKSYSLIRNKDKAKAGCTNGIGDKDKGYQYRYNKSWHVLVVGLRMWLAMLSNQSIKKSIGRFKKSMRLKTQMDKEKLNQLLTGSLTMITTTTMVIVIQPIWSTHSTYPYIFK